MSTSAQTKITIEATINAAVTKVWDLWNDPQHIIQWSNASPDWHTPKAENDLRTGGTFLTRMEAKDGSFGFDFSGVYDMVKTNEQIAYTLADDRTVNITFSGDEHTTRVIETFDAEQINPIEMQQSGWQSILNNFKKYAESI